MEAHVAAIIQRVLGSELRCREAEERADAALARAVAAEQNLADTETRLHLAEDLLEQAQTITDEVRKLGREIDVNGAIRVEEGELDASGQTPRVSLGRLVSSKAYDVFISIFDYFADYESETDADMMEDTESEIFELDDMDTLDFIL